MRQGRILEIIETVESCIVRAEGFIGNWNASAEELAAIERLRAARASGSIRAVLEELIVIGDLQHCPVAFWREMLRAANLMWPQQSPVIDDRERSQRTEFLEELRKRM